LGLDKQTVKKDVQKLCEKRLRKHDDRKEGKAIFAEAISVLQKGVELCGKKYKNLDIECVFGSKLPYVFLSLYPEIDEFDMLRISQINRPCQNL
jgi:hypothetical protein